MWEHFYGVRGLVEPFLRRFGHVRVRPLGLRPHEVDAAIATRRSVWPAHEPAFDMRARHARLNARMPRTIRPGRFAVIAFDSGGRLDAWTGHHSGRGRSALGSGREDLQRLAASKGALHDDASVAARERAADGILLEWAVREEQLRRELWRDCVALLREPGAEVRYRQPVAAAFVDIWRGLVLIPRGTAPAVDNALLALEEARQGLRRRLARILSQ